MAQPVVHFDIIGQRPDTLRQFYSDLFGWSFAVSEPGTSAMEPVVGHYGLVEPTMSSAGVGIPGGVGGGADFESRAYFYVGVADVADTLNEVERLGGTRILGPRQDPETGLTVALFEDPDGAVIGLANAT